MTCIYIYYKFAYFSTTMQLADFFYSAILSLQILPAELPTHPRAVLLSTCGGEKNLVFIYLQKEFLLDYFPRQTFGRYFDILTACSDKNEKFSE